MKHILVLIFIFNTVVIKAEDCVNIFTTDILCNVDSLLKIDGEPISYAEKCKYAENDELNGWKDRDSYYNKPYLRTRQDFIDEFISEATVRLLGTISINANNKKELILCKKENSKNIYLIDKKNEKECSVINICKAINDGVYDAIHISTSCLGNGVFLKSRFNSSDLIYIDRPECSFEVLDIFSFNGNGDIIHFKYQ